ncbi:aspartyl-tRNA synthetase [Lentisphaera araneosa HTCC2155]|uniref:Aspartyl-tRNA synthetase n=1 Tax=Lentisphaera araneosa HTCC2155 TaxID=313628 RepID=A6DKA6_9BACT|nr:aspartyl-tRNA synthetase [Lentisphaera araneosa HTCC2155]
MHIKPVYNFLSIKILRTRNIGEHFSISTGLDKELGNCKSLKNLGKIMDFLT